MKLQLLKKHLRNVGKYFYFPQKKKTNGRFAADRMPYVDLIETQIKTRCFAIHQFFYSL